MTVILRQFELFYASVPKVACTSIKHLFFEAENGFSFRRFTVNGQKQHIHGAVYPALTRDRFPEKLIAGFHRVAVVRDPIKRFLSAYSNRVVHFGELSNVAKLRTLDLEPDPDLGLFIRELERYRAASGPVAHHTRPMSDFLGTDPDYYARLYRMEELDRFVEDMNARMGTSLALKHLQTGGPKLNAGDLSAAQIDRLREFYKADYAAFGSYF